MMFVVVENFIIPINTFIKMGILYFLRNKICLIENTQYIWIQLSRNTRLDG